MTQGNSSGLLRVGEVAELFGVAPKTVTRWAKDGRLPAIRTVGGHHRFFSHEVLRLFDAEEAEEPPVLREAVVLPFVARPDTSPGERPGRVRRPRPPGHEPRP